MTGGAGAPSWRRARTGLSSVPTLLVEPWRDLALPHHRGGGLRRHREQGAVLRPYASGAVEVTAGSEVRVHVEQDPVGVGHGAVTNGVVEAGASAHLPGRTSDRGGHHVGEERDRRPCLTTFVHAGPDVP